MDTTKSDTSPQKCIYGMLDICLRQDLSKTTNQQTCNNCISARAEKHLYELKLIMKQLLAVFSTGNSRG